MRTLNNPFHYSKKSMVGGTGEVVTVFVLGITLSQATQCGEDLLSAKKKQDSGLLGVFMPQCEQDGTYKSKQCWASTGECCCVDTNGVRITNYTRAAVSCECIKKKYTVQKQGLIGSYVPQCQRDGSYEPLQCYGSTGQCWCATEDGKQVSQGSVGLSSCGCLIKKYNSNLKGLLGRYTPRCEADGTYSPLQFHAGYAWCADADGTRVNNKTRSLKACKCVLERAVSVREGLLGSFRPKCDADGTYAPMQCHENNCWCARPDGSNMQVKAKSLETCKCFRQQDAIFATGMFEF
ncbi:Equistatin [Nymphon striatum]|nr:Equistatin [Nymphon striatum]